jgi:hypothetical protein
LENGKLSKTNDIDNNNGKRTEQVLDDIIHNADDYYNYLQQKHVSDTRLDVGIVSLIVWFASFVALGVGAITTIKGSMAVPYLLAAFLASIAIAIVTGVIMYTFRRRRGFKFNELGLQLKKMKEGGRISSEDGLHLMDLMQQARLVAKKRKLDSAFKYAVLAFAIVAIIGLNAGIAAVAAIIVYIYLRFETLRESERQEAQYEQSKQMLLQNL